MTTYRACNCGEIPNAFTTLKPALEALKYGDTLLLHHKDTFDAPGQWETFDLRDKGTPPTGTDADYITITSDDPTGTPAALSGYPKHDVRITSAMAARMPRVRAISSMPVFWVNKNAKYWKVERLNITTAPGASAIRLIGLGEDPPNTPQEYPDHIIFQLNWIHPHEEVGEPLTQATIFRSAESAFYLEGTNIAIRQNAMQGFVCKYRDGGQPPHTCLLMTTWADNVLVENNLMEAWTYTFFFGGGSKGIATKTATVSNCTSTSATFSNTNGLSVGMAVAVLVYSHVDSIGIFREVWGSAIVKSINGSTVTYEAPLCNSNNTDGGGNTCMPFDSNNLRQIPADGSQARWDGLQVQNVTVRRNIIAHRPEWTVLMDNNCGGKGYLELKSGQNITIDGNVFKGCTGPTITARNQGGPDPWNDLDNLKLTNNYFMNANSPFTAYLNDGGNLTNKSKNVTYHNNLVVGQFSNPDDYRWITVIAGVFTGGKDMRVTHNTVLVGAYRSFSSYADPRSQMEGLEMRDNIFRAAPIAGYTDGRGIAGASVTECWPGARVFKNVLLKVDDQHPDEDIKHNWINPYPENKLIHGVEAAGFTRPSPTLDASGDYRIHADSPLKGTASDGTDPGVNYPQLIASLGFDPNDPAVVVPPAPPVPAPTPTPTPTPTPAPTPTPPATDFLWERVPGSPDSAQTLAFVGSTLYVGTMLKGVFAYDGTRWTQVNNGFPATPVWIGNFHVTRGGSLLASVRFSGMGHSSTWRLSGGTWIESIGARNEYAAFYASDRDGNILASTNTAAVLRSIDEGSIFEQFSQVPPVGGVGSSSFSIGSGSDGTIYLYSHDTGLHYSIDGGKTWNHLGSPTGPSGNQTALTSNAQGQLIAATGFGGIYRNRGTLQSPVIQLETNLQVSNNTGAHSLIRLADGTLISHFIRLFCSRDGGDTWTRCDDGIPAGTTSGAQNVQSLHTGDLAQGPDGKVYVGFLDAGFGVWRTTTGGQVPTPVPVPSPVPVPPTPPTTPTGMIRVVGRALQDETSIVGVKVTLQGMETVSREGDALFWFDTPVPIGSVITGSKDGWVFEPVTVKEGVPLFGLQGRPVATTPTPPVPPPTPTPTPEPPQPQPEPPTSTPTCTIDAPNQVTIPANRSGQITVNVTSDASLLPFPVSAVSDSGQVIIVPPTSREVKTPSALLSFGIRVKKRGGNVTINSPCGVRVVKVNVV